MDSGRGSIGPFLKIQTYFVRLRGDLMPMTYDILFMYNFFYME